MKYTEVIEDVARTIYHYEGGLCPDEFEKITGQTKRPWKQIYSFQKDPLAEHERDEYRWQAKEVIQYLLDNNLIYLKVQKSRTDV